MLLRATARRAGATVPRAAVWRKAVVAGMSTGGAPSPSRLVEVQVPDDLALIDPREADAFKYIAQDKTLVRKLKRGDMIADYVAQLMNTSSLTLVVHGDLTPLKIKQSLGSIGWTVMRVKSKLLTAAVRKMAALNGKELSEEQEQIAVNLGRGLTTMAFLTEPLQGLVTDATKLAVLESLAPLEDAKDGVFQVDAGIVVAGYIKDHGKRDSDIWLTRSGLNTLLTRLKEDAADVPGAADREPHALYHAKLVGGLRGQLGAVRVPLTKPGMTLSSTVDKVPHKATGVFQQLKLLREQQESKED